VSQIWRRTFTWTQGLFCRNSSLFRPLTWQQLDSIKIACRSRQSDSQQTQKYMIYKDLSHPIDSIVSCEPTLGSTQFYYRYYLYSWIKCIPTYIFAVYTCLFASFSCRKKPRIEGWRKKRKRKKNCVFWENVRRWRERQVLKCSCTHRN